MRALNSCIRALSRLSWWPAVVGVVFVTGTGLAAFNAMRPNSFEEQKLFGSQAYFRDRLSRSFYLAASVQNAVVLITSTTNDDMQLLLVNFDTGKKIRLGIERSHLFSPYLSPDGGRLIFSRQRRGLQAHDLISCETATLTCQTLLKSNASLHSAIEISGNRILYASSPYVKGSDGKVRLNRNDIWIFDPATGARQLTDLRLYELGSLSMSNDSIYFSATGSRKDRPIIPKYDPDSNDQSNIFRLPFNPMTAAVEMPTEVMAPMFASTGIATRPSASTDGSLIAYLRTKTGINPYRYELVIADGNSHSERLIETSGLGFSQPVVIGHDVYASVTKSDRVSILVDRPGENPMTLLADIDDASAVAAETVELKIMQ
jgi:hypothetical protein